MNCGESQFRHPLDVMKLIILRQSKKKTENNSRFTDVHLFRPDNSLFVLAIDNAFFFLNHTKVFIELQKEKLNASVSRETWAGKPAGSDSEAASLHTRWPVV